MWPRLRLLIGAMIVTIIAGIICLQSVNADDGETFFVITAYYSPLPDQIRYTTWSYSGDIRLNGGWVTTASGNWVFPGLLAGPANYPFGTKIYFEWYGIWAIEDRGGAIVKAGERGHSYDRIDIWMGYGDEGLTRALSWGTRTIKWKIVVPSADVSLNFWESTIGTLTKLSVNPESSTTQDVKTLQEILSKAELYTWEIDGDYNSIQEILIDFQVNNNVIASRDDISAWWYGPKTIAALRTVYGNNTTTLIEEDIELFKNFNHKEASEKYKIILEYWDLQVTPESSTQTVQELQNLLSILWEYNWSIDGNYSSVESSLISLQKKIGLIEKSDDWGAWYFWNKTKSALWIYYEKEDEDEENNTHEITNTQEVIEIEKETVHNEVLEESTFETELSLEEQDRLSVAFKKLQLTRSVAYINKLLTQIEDLIPVIEDSEIKLKLLYLQEISK